MSNVNIELIKTNGGTQPRSTIRQDWVKDYADDMQSGAMFPAIIVFHDGADYWLADGFHRLHAAIMLGKEDIDVDLRQGTRRDAVLYSVSANGTHGQRRTNEDKRRAVLTLLNDAEWGKWSDREIARQCGVTHPFVSTLRTPPSGNDYQIAEPRTVTRNGTTYTQNTANIGRSYAEPAPAPAYAAPSPFYAASAAQTPDYSARHDAEEESSNDETQIVEPKQGASFPVIPPPSYEPEIAPHVRGTFGTGVNEWYTPAEYIEAARAVMGEFTLDPASSELANQTVKAEFFYTQEEDGLEQPWTGKVWLNPPYAQPFIAQFVAKLVEEYGKNDVTEAILLTHNYTDTAWFQMAARASDAICFTRGRIGFLSPDGVKAAPTQGQAFCYFGKNAERFQSFFSGFGFVVRRM